MGSDHPAEGERGDSVAEQIVIDRRYCGPPKSGNGGYVCGLLAGYVDGMVEVTLRLPPPIDTPLEVVRSGGGAKLMSGDAVVAEGAPAHMDIEEPAAVSLPDAVQAAKSYPGFKDHPFPTCFVCGPDRAGGDGLRIFPGAVDGRELVAAPWTPDGSLAGDGGVVRPEFVWAALDCPSGFGAGLGGDLVMVLGRLAAELRSPVYAGRRYAVVGWSINTEGRKRYSGSALFDEGGALCAVSKATWIQLDETPPGTT